MRYFYLGVLLIVALIINSLLAMPYRTVWEFVSLVIIDIGLLVGVYAIYQRYWAHGHWRKKDAGLIIVWLGTVFSYMGAYILITGNYHLEGDRIRTAIVRDILNAIGDYFGPFYVAVLWFIIGTIAIYFGWKGYKNA